MVARPKDEILVPPVTEHDWMEERAASRGIDLKDVL
jgi:hypothetical protein